MRGEQQHGEQQGCRGIEKRVARGREWSLEGGGEGGRACGESVASGSQPGPRSAVPSGVRGHRCEGTSVKGQAGRARCEMVRIRTRRA
jgi:hypothetical protein